MNKKRIFRYIALFGNVIYVLWILYNGINEGYKNIFSVQTIVLIGLIFLLTINFFLLL